MSAQTAAEARIALLEAELEKYKMYKSERDSLERAYDKATKDRNHWHDKAQEYRQQSVEYRKSRDKWCEVAMRDQLSSRDTLPRVITADELRDGQEVAGWHDHEKFAKEWIAGRVHKRPSSGFLIGDWAAEGFSPIVLLADAPEPSERAGKEVSPYELQVGDVVDVWHGDDVQEPYYPSATIESASPLIADQFDFEGLELSFPRFQFRLLKRPDKKPDNPWFATVYEGAPYLAATWRGTPVRPQSIRAGDLYDIHTAHGSRITGVVAARNGVRNPQNGDMYRIVNRKA